jgi:hypothetical protein
MFALVRRRTAERWTGRTRVASITLRPAGDWLRGVRFIYAPAWADRGPIALLDAR